MKLWESGEAADMHASPTTRTGFDTTKIAPASKTQVPNPFGMHETGERHELLLSASTRGPASDQVYQVPSIILSHTRPKDGVR